MSRRWWSPSTWLWHALRLTYQSEKAGSRLVRAVRFHLGWTCGALPPAHSDPWLGRWGRCWLQRRHYGDHQAPDDLGSIVSWPGHPAGSARPGAPR